MSEEKPGKFRRILRFSGKKSPSNLYFRLAEGKFEQNKNIFLNNEPSIKVKGGEVLDKNDELRIPILFNNGKSEVEITYSWND